MANSTFQIPELKNEEIKDYIKNSNERKEVIETYNTMYNENIKIPLYIGKEEIITEERRDINPPHDHNKIVGSYSICNSSHVKNAINCALEMKDEWTNTPWEDRAAIFLKAWIHNFFSNIIQHLMTMVRSHWDVKVFSFIQISPFLFNNNF